MMAGVKPSFARLSESHLSDIAQSFRNRSHDGDMTAGAIADAVESVIRVRCDANVIRQRSPAVRVQRVLRRVAGWAVARA
ncbi:hypothetical protein ACSFA3_10025 [Variovorax sp. RHLX14]